MSNEHLITEFFNVISPTNPWVSVKISDRATFDEIQEFLIKDCGCAWFGAIGEKSHQIWGGRRLYLHVDHVTNSRGGGGVVAYTGEKDMHLAKATFMLDRKLVKITTFMKAVNTIKDSIAAKREAEIAALQDKVKKAAAKRGNIIVKRPKV